MEFIYLSLNFFRLPDIILFVVIIRVYFIIILMAFEQETWLCLCYIVSQQFDLVSMTLCVTLIAINDTAHDLTLSAICGNNVSYIIVSLQTTKYTPPSNMLLGKNAHVCRRVHITFFVRPCANIL